MSDFVVAAGGACIPTFFGTATDVAKVGSECPFSLANANLAAGLVVGGEVTEISQIFPENYREIEEVQRDIDLFRKMLIGSCVRWDVSWRG